MKKSMRTPKLVGWISGCGLLLGLSGSCLPDNLFADTAGQIVSGLIISTLNLMLSGANLQI